MTLLTIAAEDFIPSDERPYFGSDDHRERCIDEAIAKARQVIGGDATNGSIVYNAVITAQNTIVAVVRWNLDAITKDSDDAIEDLRFPTPIRY